MPLVTQQGEVADRLRSFFRLTGRIPSTLDETVVPIAQVQNLDAAPWRLTTVRWMTNRGVAAVAADQGFAGVMLRRPGAAVVEDVWVRNVTGAALTAGLWIQMNAEALVGAVVGSGAPNIERMGAAAAAASIARTPVEAIRYSTIGLDPTALLLATFVIPANETYLVRPFVTLRTVQGTNLLGATPVSTGLYVAAPAINVPIEANFAGTYYPDG